MKKTVCLFLMFLLAVSFSGCGDKAEPAKTETPAATAVPVTEAPASPKPASPEPEPATPEPATPEPAPAAAEPLSSEVSAASAPAWYVKAEDCAPVDVDLTPLSITMLYAQVTQMNYSPQEYIGKRVKTVGQFAYYPMADENGNPIEGQGYYVCLVNDSTACCSSGLEFILKGDPKYPEDYPKQNSVITVAGEFQTYYEGEYMYSHLVNAEIVTK